MKELTTREIALKQNHKLTKVLNTLLHVATDEELTEIKEFLFQNVSSLSQRKENKLLEKVSNQKDLLDELK